MKILLVEDEECLLEAMSYILREKGYTVNQALNGEMGLGMAVKGDYDILIVDYLLPKRDGMSLLREFRRFNLNTPVILLTARDAIEDRVRALDAGADDYIVKPFSVDELLARLRVLTRREKQNLLNEKVEAAGWILDTLSGLVTIGTKHISLTAKESSLLELLMRNYGIVLSKQRILERVWGYNSDIVAENVNLYIYYLRKKLGTRSIKTVRGFGYCLKADSDVRNADFNREYKRKNA
jgi:DNA-binding response OmpR family regulator